MPNMDSIQLKTKELQSKMYLTQTQTHRLKTHSLTHWTHKIGNLIHYMLPKCLLLYSGHPLYDATCGPLQLAHLGFLVSPAIFCRVAETLAVEALCERNWLTKFLHLIIKYASYIAN